jgi:Tfp pilus assembly protein PilF
MLYFNDELMARSLRPFFVAFLCVALVLVCSSLADAQSSGGVDQTGTGGQHTIQGRIYFPSGRRSDFRLMVKLQSHNSGELSVLSDANGSFSFRGLTSGSYTVVIDGGDDYETVSEAVYIETYGGNNSRTNASMPGIARLYTVQISLQPKQSSSARPGVLNAALASIPVPARELYQKALDASQAGRRIEAIDNLSAALVIYPEFPLALNELGVQYLKLGQAAKAAEALGRAVKLAPNDFQPRLNYGIALLNQRRLAEAEGHLRVAVSMNTSAPMGHMYLGIVLASQRKLEEAERELGIAIGSKSSEVALAHRYLGGVFWAKRDYQRAVTELETYLKLVPKAKDAKVLRQKIKELHDKKLVLDATP